ncbi:SPOSA6832_00339 [Sporobolomyces salmonicolor]|uniref:SPOSA6832_00339-mRNA-1:cds n=1 Tax=Sporidiobolus salmonicolor TaxID=5005 RepID=A0A0D6EGH3_SPOSA|nr:SPOSA6832_00339 [Sporobolomyces salmonicolor]
MQGTAVVTTCSHIFCLECANALFSVPQICPACETALPDLCARLSGSLKISLLSRRDFSDDVVQATLSPHDSYKTSILSGLAPSVILDIASRALNFHTYQIHAARGFLPGAPHQERAGGRLPSALCNVIAREATAEISRTEKALEIERRRVRDLQETHKANAKAYSKLKAQYDKSKQRALLNPGFTNALSTAPAPSHAASRQTFVPAQGDAVPGRASSSTSSRQNRMNWNARAGTHTGPFAQAQTRSGGAGSALRARRPLNEQTTHAHSSGDAEYGRGTGGGAQAFFGGVGKNSQSAATNKHGQPPSQNGTPTYFGQQVPHVAASGPASESATRGGFRPASFGHG